MERDAYSFLSDADKARIHELQAMIADFETGLAESIRIRKAHHARIAATANAVYPGATDLVRAAAANPNVNPQNFAQWARAKLASVVNAKVAAALIPVLGFLFLAATRSLMQEEEQLPPTYYETFLAAASRMAQGSAQLFGPLPPDPYKTAARAGGSRAPCANESVVDAVFAKAERKTDGR